MAIDLLTHLQGYPSQHIPVTYSEALKCWCVFSPEWVQRLLLSTDAGVTPYAEQLGPLTRRPELDLSGALRVLPHIPLANEGVNHATGRQAISKFNNATYGDRLARLAAALAGYVAVLEVPGQIDLTRHFFHPVIEAITRLPNEVTPQPSWPGPSQLFDRFLSLNRRKQVYERINQLYAEGTDHQLDHLDQRVALHILGYDALLGSVQQSFLKVVQAHPGTSLNRIDWPDQMPASAVPTVERVATRDLTIDQQTVRAGERIRLYLDTAEGSPDLFFGGGRHKCVGMGISQKIWQAFADVFRQARCTVRVLEVHYPTSDFVFNCPNQLLVDLTPP